MTNLLLASLGDRVSIADGRFVFTFSAGAIVAITVTHGYRSVIRRRRWVALPLTWMLPRVLVASLVLGTTITVVVTPAWILVFGEEVSPAATWAPAAVLGWSWMVF